MEIERKHPLAKCEECPWYEKSSYVGEAGPEKAGTIVVGEAPGAVEARTGIPFTGPAGQLLDRVFTHHNIDRGGLRFTNVVACHPPYNPSKGASTPPAEVIACCKPRLDSELSERLTIVCLGNTAAKTILNTNEGILSLRIGPPKKIKDTIVVATVHPLACLRQSDLFPNLVKDIGKLVNQDLWVGFEPPTIAAFDDVESAQKAVRELQQFEELTVDIEVDVAAVKDLNTPGGKLLCIGISYAPNKAIVFGERALADKSVQNRLRELLSSKKLTCHNGKFDIAKLLEYGYLHDTSVLSFDTMLASYTFDERPGYHGLKGLASEILGAPDYVDEINPFIEKGGGYGNIPRPILYKYCAYDAAFTFLLKEHFEHKYKDEPNLRMVHDRLVMYSRELIYVEREGVRFDLDYNAQLYAQFDEQLKPLEMQMVELGLLNPRSPKQVKEWFESNGLILPDTTEDTLKNLYERRRDIGLLGLLLEHRKAQKSFSTYVKGLRKRVYEDRIYSTFLLHGSVTGRTASRNPNLQNITRGVVLRKQFIPDSGNVFVQADYGQIELRVAALEAQDEYLIGVFNDPSRDIFDEIGTNIYGSLEAAKRKENRVRTKAYVYGMNYGREAASIAGEYKIPIREAEKGMNTFFGMVPGIVAWREQIQQELKSQALKTIFHRRRRFWLITKDNRADATREGWAFIPQSTANDVTLTALTRARQAGMSVRIPVHDSIMVECSDDPSIIGDVRRDLSRIMVDTARDLLGDRVPFIADTEVGYNWGELSE